MDAILSLFATTDREPEGELDARRLQHATTGALAALVIAALWGAAVGSVSAHLAVANLYKVPMVLLLSTLSALPAGTLAWRALGADRSLTSFVTALATGMLGASLVLGASAPLVALYTHTSTWVGPLIAEVSVAAALVVGAAAFARAALSGATAEQRPRRIAAVAVCAVIQLAAALQLNALAAPILPAGTAFSAGIDGLGAGPR